MPPSCIIIPKFKYTHFGFVCAFFIVAPSVSLSATTTATQGNPLSLDCNPIGQPSPSVTWYKDNIQLIPNSRISIDNEDRLMFSSVISADGGSYRCEATNSAGMDSATTTLTVLGRCTYMFTYMYTCTSKATMRDLLHVA
jgi:hypothetical protein